MDARAECLCHERVILFHSLAVAQPGPPDWEWLVIPFAGAATKGDAVPRLRTRRSKKRITLWVLGVLVGVVVLLALLIVVINVVIVDSSRAHIVANVADAPSAKVAIVLGAKVDTKGVPSPMLADRLDTAIRLYKEGKVTRLLMSGDHGTATYDEVNAMLNYATSRGVPSKDVFTDHAGFDTYDTMYRARDVFKVTKALVVTQRFHLARAVYTARGLGLDATGVPADIQSYRGEWRFAARDWLARVKAFFQLHVTHPKPRFLGPAIPIDGDGAASRG